MNQTQLTRVTHKVILHTIQKQLLTLATGMKQLLLLEMGILNKHY